MGYGSIKAADMPLTSLADDAERKGDCTRQSVRVWLGSSAILVETRARRTTSLS
jgi:hypothetical protein